MNKKILITSGTTRAYLDAVRYISNTSTGKLGCEIATESLRLGASVTMLYGTDSSIPPVGAGLKPAPTNAINHLTLIEIETLDDLLSTIQQKLIHTHFDIIIHAMAVPDYVPERRVDGKVPSGKDDWTVKLTKTPKVIKIIRDQWPEAFLVGFKLEVGKTKEELIQIATNFQTQTKANLIVANRLEDIKNPHETVGATRRVAPTPHTAYIINDKGEVTGEFHNKKSIAEGLAKMLNL